MSKRLYSGRYEVQEFIADGEMGAMHKAWDNTSFDHMVALQVIHSHLSSDASFIDRFRDAARKTAQLQAHPNIIKIFDVEHDHGIDYLVMEYFPSTNLRDHIQSHGKFRIRDATLVIRQIGEALSHTHSCDLLHRDIKPANILIDTKQHVKLTDFGIAKAMSDAPLTATGQLIGTLKYMAPEQAGHLKLDGRTDLYSLGMVFYELVTGKNLWNNIPNLTIYSHLQNEQTVPPLNFPPGVPQEIQEVIKDLLRFDPTKRIQSAQSLVTRLDNLEPILSNSPSGEHEEDPDATIVIPRNNVTEKLGEDTTEIIQHTPTLPPSTQEPSMSSKTSIKKQPPRPQASNKSALEDDPAAKAKDPAKPYYFVDDSHSFNKHREETEAKKPLFSDQFPAADPHSSPSFFTIKKMVAVVFLFLVGAALYWNQSFFAPSQPSQEKLVIQDTENREIQEKNEQDFVGIQASELNQQAKTIASTKTTKIVQQTDVVRDIQTADVAQQAKATDDAQVAKLAQQTPPTTNIQAAELAEQPKVAADAQVAERAQQAKAAATAQTTERARQAQDVANAQTAKLARQAKAAADIQAAEQARQAKAAADAQVAERARQAKAAADIQAAEQARQAKAAVDAQAEELAQQAKTAANTLAVEQTQQTKAAAKTQAEELYQQAKAAVEAQAAATAQAAERARQAQAATAETQALLSLLEQLRGSVAKKDLSALQRLSTMSESRYRMLKDLFLRYRTVEISIGDVIRTPAKATATFQITKLIRPNGVIVRPHPIVQNIKVTVLKDKEDWDLPAW